MKTPVLHAIAFTAAALASGCAEFEQTLSTVGPTSLTSVASLLGTWSSSSIGAEAGSCTSLQWAVTSQQGSSVSGAFSAVCGSISVAGTVSGQVNGNDVPYQITGAATLPGAASCPVSASGTARLEGDAIRVPYSGSTCLGPLQGEELLRRPAAPAPSPAPAPAPAPETPASPTPSPSAFHVGPGALTCARAEHVVNATADEFPGLISPRATEVEGISAAVELLRRMIWHLQLAGYQAGRQGNPSGAISNDKLTAFCDGGWHAFDVLRSLATPGEPADVIFLEVFPASTVADGGIPD